MKFEYYNKFNVYLINNNIRYLIMKTFLRSYILLFLISTIITAQGSAGTNAKYEYRTLIDMPTAGILENPQAKVGQGGQQVIKDIGLQLFVASPGLIPWKYIDFKGEATFGGGELTDQEGHLVMDIRIAL